jgi:O-antigen ligase
MSAAVAVTSLARGMIDRLIADLQNPARWMATLDIVTILLVVVLPWSTTAVAILAASLFVLSLPMLDLKAFVRALKTPASVTALLFFALGAVGVLWSFDASWTERLYGAGQLVKLLLMPLLLYHFSRSRRGAWILIAFATSCGVLLAWSWLNWLLPSHIGRIGPSGFDGVPAKNYITQSQEFALCAFVLAAVAYQQMLAGKRFLASALAVLSFAFVANLLFVITARTALVYGPVLLLLFAVRYFNRFTGTIFVAMALVVAALAWSTSPILRLRVTDIAQEYELYKTENAATSTGQRLEYWRKSLKFISEAPLFGHGTGSTLELFEKDAVGQSGVSAEVIGNPHNQTLNVAVQWGLLGVLALYAMWFAHLRLFLGEGIFSWIGLAAVTENIASSVFNSHITDFNEGWLYVLAVGIAGGLVLQQQNGATLGVIPARD